MAYPNSAGFKEKGGTSEAAAHAMRGSAETLRARVLAELRKRSLTTDECAAALNESVLSIRPRFSELSAMNKIERDGRKRPNASGHAAWVWRLKANGHDRL